MADARSKHPADQTKYLTQLLNEEYQKLEECYRNIAQIGKALHRLGEDSEQRLLMKD